MHGTRSHRDLVLYGICGVTLKVTVLHCYMRDAWYQRSQGFGVICYMWSDTEGHFAQWPFIVMCNVHCARDHPTSVFMYVV